MYRDSQLSFADSPQAVTVTAASQNNIDLTVAGDAADPKNPLILAIRVVEGATAAGAATVTVDLQTDSDVAFGTQTTLFSSGPIPVASLTANTWIVKLPLPRGMKQFSRVYYTVATGPLLTGTFDGFVTTAADVRR